LVQNALLLHAWCFYILQQRYKTSVGEHGSILSSLQPNGR
jgi:hypothetical protein